MYAFKSCRAGRSGVAAALAFACCSGFANAQAPAQETVDPDSILGDVVVTAQKREESAQDVGISISTFNAAQIESLGFTDTRDIAAQTPALSVFTPSAGITVLNIRGVSQNDFADHLEPPIAVYVDDGYIGTGGAVGGQMFDIARVEVLRGPQGTLFGRNATGGLIHYITQEPTEVFDANLSVTLAEYEEVQVQGAISGPLSDSVRARLSFISTRDDGYQENRIGPDLSNQDNYAVRGQLAIDLTEETDLLLRLSYARNDERGPGYSYTSAVWDVPPSAGGPLPFPGFTGSGLALEGGSPTTPHNGTFFAEPDNDPHTGAWDNPGRHDREVIDFQMRFRSQLSEGVTFTSATDFLTVDKVLDIDVDASSFAMFNFFQDMDYQQFTQEFRLNGQTERLDWVLGAFYLSIDGNYNQTVFFDPDFIVDFLANFVPPFNGAPFTIPATGYTPGQGLAPNSGDYSVDVRSWALFGQAEYQLTPTLSGTLGVRYTADEKEDNFHWENPTYGISTSYDPSLFPDAARDFENYSVRAGLDWQPTADTLLFAAYNRGHKGGNWAQPVFAYFVLSGVLGDPRPSFAHDEEVLSSYEIGLKQDFWSGRARLNASAFYYDYQDYQAFSLAGLAQGLVNRDAEVTGGEIEFQVAPFQGLEMSIGAAFIDTNVEDYPIADGTVSVDREMPNAPDLMLNGLARYEWEAFNGTMSAQVSGRYVGEQFFSVTNSPALHEDSYSTADVRFGYESGGGHWNFAVWGRNVTDEEYRVYALDIAALGWGIEVYGPPSWWGVTLGYKY